MLSGDPLTRVLTVDLARRRFEVTERPELFEKGLGGAGAAIQLLSETCPCLIFVAGPNHQPEPSTQEKLQHHL